MINLPICLCSYKKSTLKMYSKSLRIIEMFVHKFCISLKSRQLASASCKQTFHITKVRTSQKVKCAMMRNLSCKIFNPEAAVRRCSVENSQEHNCARVSFNKVAGLRLATLLKKRFWRRCFPENFAKFLRTVFLQNTFGGCFC